MLTPNLKSNWLNKMLWALFGLLMLSTIPIMGQDISVANATDKISDVALPTAVFTVWPEEGEPPLTVTLDASNSQGNILEYKWTTDNGQVAFGQNATLTFNSPGIYTITLTVTDNDGVTRVAQQEIWLGLPGDGGAELPGEPPIAHFTVSSNSGPAPLSITLDASDSFDPDGVITDYDWSISDGRTLTRRVVTLVFEKAGNYTISLVVTDEGGRSSRPAQQTVTVDKIQPLSQSQTISVANAHWKVLTNRSQIVSLSLSADNKTLWVGTSGGLEQRDAETRQLLNLLTSASGLPGNGIGTLLPDGKGGLWVATLDGLAYHNALGEWTTFNTENSGLPNDYIYALLLDGHGGLWIATWGAGLVHRSATGEWRVFNTDNSALPHNRLTTLHSDDNGGIWIGTWEGGLAHRNASGEWHLFNTENSGLPDNHINTLLSDNLGGIWIGTWGGGLAQYNATGEWHIFNMANSELPSNAVNTLLSDGQGGLWIGCNWKGLEGMIYPGGLAHRNAAGEWQIFNTDNSGLPDNGVNALLLDNKGGLWVGTSAFSGKEGLAYRTVTGDWDILKTDLSGLPSNEINTLIEDNNGGLWIGTAALDQGGGHLAHYTAANEWHLADNAPNPEIKTLLSDNNGGIWIGTWGSGIIHRNATGERVIFNTENSALPSNHITSLISDSQGGLWIGTSAFLTEGGLAHRDASGNWRIFKTNNSDLPDNNIYALLADDNQGIWIGTLHGLAHHSATGEWRVFNQDNSGLPDNQIKVLLSDNKKGILVGTHKGGLAHRTANGDWRIFNTDNSEMPHNEIKSLLSDDNDGLWIGTWGGGLVHYTANNEWIVFTTSNSSLPDDYINTLLSDGKGGLWIGSWGLAHLSFDQTLTGDLSGKRATLLIYPESRQGNIKHLTSEKIAGYAYQALSDRYYRHDDIYFLAYKPDIDVNGDYQSDTNVVVDAPITFFEKASGTTTRSLTSEDIRQAFNWAKAKGALNQPLLVTFIADGLSDGKLLLNPETQEALNATELATIIEDYQQTTENEVIVIIEASYAGTMISHLAPPNRPLTRIIITSTRADQPTLHSNVLGEDAFTKRYFKALRRGSNFWEAFHQVSSELLPQTPQIDDDNRGGRLAKQMCLNGCFSLRPEKTVYHDGETARITLPQLPAGKVAYVLIGFPDGQTMLNLKNKNDFTTYEETSLSAWQGSEALVIEWPITADLQRGEYRLYLLRVKTGVEPLSHPEFWELNVGSVTIE